MTPSPDRPLQPDPRALAPARRRRFRRIRRWYRRTPTGEMVGTLVAIAVVVVVAVAALVYVLVA